MGAPQDLGVDPSQDAVCHFGAPWRIFEVLIEGMVELRNLFSESWSEGQITQGLTSFQTPLAILDEEDG